MTGTIKVVEQGEINQGVIIKEGTIEFNMVVRDSAAYSIMRRLAQIQDELDEESRN